MSICKYTLLKLLGLESYQVCLSFVMYTILLVIACVTLLKTTLAGNCTTPSGTDGNCISIRSCPRLIDALTTLNENYFKAVKKSVCGVGTPPLVCCPTANGKKTKNDQTILPSKQYCGYQHTDDYYVNKNRGDPNIDEFPWLGSVFYLDTHLNTRIILCSCTLITERYCLTAAHCVTNVRHYKIESVQLGDYNLSEQKDCVYNGDLEDCSDPVMEYRIEETTVHPKYSSNPMANDIALLRLNASVTYSDFIRPICLPVQGTPMAKVGDIIYATGWGNGIVAGQTVSLKKRVPSDLLPNEVCSQYYANSAKVKMTEHLSCTSGKGHDDCQGHPAGPFMLSNKNQWHLESINSMGTSCGTNTPAVNTNIRGYMDWILESIRP